MSEPDPTGYRESPDTADDDIAPDGGAIEGADGDATLTTDDSAQSDDGVVRPGNTPD